MALHATLSFGLAQTHLTPPSTGSWRIRTSPQVDLWYHGLAVLGYGAAPAGAPLPLYDSTYAAAVRGRSPMAASRALAETFAKDTAYEFLHFVSLYFLDADPMAMLDAVEAVARTEPGAAPRLRDVRLQFGAAVLAAALPRGRQRAPLREFAQALRRDWADFFGAYWDSAVAARRTVLDSAQMLWDSTFAPRLKPLLFAAKLDEGMVLVSLPLGPEGRLVTGDRRRNVAAVRFAQSPEEIVYAVVREMCFEWGRGVVQDYVAPVERRGRERELEAYAAVRCGALVMDRVLPERADAYRAAYAVPVVASFEQAYPIPESVLRGLGERLDFLLDGL